MELNSDEMLANVLRDTLREGVKAMVSRSYNNPIEKLISDAITAHSPELNTLLVDAIKTCVNDAAFREELMAATRTCLAKTLIQRFGGELEKQVNSLKSDPSTRARITIAIEEIVKSRVS